MRIKTETAVGIFILLAIGAFMYLTFQIGVFRFDRAQYAPYVVYFKDANGLTKKTDVKIAGVKVGWVEQVDLLPETNKVQTKLMLQKDFVLRKNARVLIRQEGLLGTRYVEIIPGSPTAGELTSSTLQDDQSASPVAVDELLVQMQKIAHNIEHITQKLNTAFSNENNQRALQDVVTHISSSAEKLSQVSDSVHTLVSTQQEKISKTLDHIQLLTQQLTQKVPNYDKVAERVMRQVEQTTQSVYNTSEQIHQLADEIKKEPGGLGKFLCGEEGYSKLQSSLTTVQRYTHIMQRWSFGSIGHLEVLRPLQDQKQRQNQHNIKTYFNFQWDFLPSFALIGGITTSLQGYSRDLRDNKHVTGNLQLGYRYGQFGLRIGIFESTAGCALDAMFDFSKRFESTWFKPALTSSLEIFDWRGAQRCYMSNEPHIKWLNRIWINPHWYVVAGLDDIASPARSSFAGAGFNIMF